MPGEADSIDVAIVGAGFSGLYMLHKLRALGLSARVFEAGDGVGGTWFWNCYPGARVDIESQEYSYSFSPELEDDWRWSEKYAAQPELLRYLNHVADRFDLRRDIRLETRVTSAVFDERTSRWTVTTDKGDKVSARFCVMATGCLSSPKTVDIPGTESFRGTSYSTANWPKEPVDLKGKRVGIIGTGSSAIQTITDIAPKVGALTIFQRTPSFSAPARNGPADPQVRRDWIANREENRKAQRESGFGFAGAQPASLSALEVSESERRKEYDARWERGGLGFGGAYVDIILNREANDTAVAYVSERIRETVKDKAVAEKLIPRTYPLATKRMVVDTGYFEVFNQGNVTLVDISETPIEAVTTAGIRTSEKEYPFDVIIYALGFDAMTGALGKIDIRGRGGAKLKDRWAEGPRAYLGLMVSGFPNLFTVTGPGSPSVLSNMVVSIEQHVDWITDCMVRMGERQLDTIEATVEAEDAWVAHVSEVANMTLFPQANSWYMGANVPGKPRVFMAYIGGVGAYRMKCDDVAAKGYEGFALSASSGR